jgi:hypothetical protein
VQMKYKKNVVIRRYGRACNYVHLQIGNQGFQVGVAMSLKECAWMRMRLIEALNNLETKSVSTSRLDTNKVTSSKKKSIRHKAATFATYLKSGCDDIMSYPDYRDRLKDMEGGGK